MGVGEIITWMSSNIFVALLILTGILILLVIIVYLIKYLIDNAPYAYVNARVRSMESRLLDDHKLNELIEAGSLVEVVGLLEDTDYGKYISTTSKDVYSVEKSLDMHLAHIYKTLAEISPDRSKKILELFEKRYDVKNIKTILRAKYAGLDGESIFKILIPLGRIPENKLRELCEAKTVEEVVNGLEGTEYGKILSENLSIYEESGNLIPLELALDRYILEGLWKVVGIEGTNEDIFKEFIGRMIDIENLKIILRCKGERVSSEVILNYLLGVGYELPPWKLKELAEAESMEGVVSSLEGTEYSNIISGCLEEYEKCKSAYVFERALDNYLVEIGKKLSLRQPFGVGPIIGFITSKEMEVKKLKVIIKGKMEGLSPRDIRELITT
ncbi:V-type ATP synthase subunit C [Methanofervidicoccus sp. A16]|uniref:V-type ATP synthase subunit C n=1 Tax=Methanofervidicoccus sp. A16 TaxID=2607662 RepID=UPI0011889469|nr:V-type ATP synthase subunit C [Methanofervidicoccus sp. A16]AXI25270.1 V-type ATP synthase subunit C [Methanofervidicoccus sp. A16]